MNGTPTILACLPPRSRAESIRAALEKILASPGFANAERLSRFLRYTVEETLNGQTDKLKESLLGIDVFGRKPSYDPRVDAVVRTEAVKLRARLREYYESEGREDEIVIDLPKGGYIPAFRHREKPSSKLPRRSSPSRTRRREWKPAVATVLVVAFLAASVYLISKARTRSAGASSPQLASIAVLPFADLSPDHDQEYFCDGMTEEIIDALAKVNGFRVVARTSSFAFKGKQQDIREIGKKLNVATVLEGSVRKDGNRLRVTAQLNSVADGYHLWSETYERELKDVFTVQDEISRAIVDTLQLKLANSARQPRPPSANVEAYDLYLQGRYHWSRWRSEGAERAIEYFQQAIQKDPNYAAAYSGLADSYAWMGFFGALPPNEAMPKARQAALKALALDDTLAAAHTSLGYVKSLHEFDWPGAEREFKRALQLNSGDSDAHFGYGITYLAPMGHLDEALHEMQTAHDLDPLSPITNTYLGLAYHLVGNRHYAAAHFRKALELDPGFRRSTARAGQSFARRPRLREFNSELDLAKEPAPESRIDLMRAHWRMRCKAKRRKRFSLYISGRSRPAESSCGQPRSPTCTLLLGDKAQMYTWLERAYADRDGMLVYMNRQGVYRPYRSEPRFIALKKKLGFQLSSPSLESW